MSAVAKNVIPNWGETSEFFKGDPDDAFQVSILGSFLHRGIVYEIPRVRIRGSLEPHQEVLRLGIFGGIHGDEPSSCEAIVRFAQSLLWSPEQAHGYELFLYPLVNPVGHEQGTRGNGVGRDLNREFWKGSSEPEILILEAELRRNTFDGIIALHADDTSLGIYGYARGRVIAEHLLWPALRTAEAVIPRDPRAVIDGFAADNGLIRDCFEGVLSASPAQRITPFELIFETPSKESLDRQIEASVRALRSVLISYRGFIAYAPNL